MKNYKALSIVLAVALILVCAIGGTLAWLTAHTGTVTNTFTSAELFANPGEQFTLWEHEAVAAPDGTYTLDLTREVIGNSYDILPGVNIPKDPTVDVVELEEYAYLYIKVTGALNGLTYSVNSENWEAVPGYTGLYVYKGAYADGNIIKATDDAKVTFTAGILTGDGITVPTNYNGTVEDGTTLAFNAYMVQATGNGADAAEAWANTYGA